MKKWLLACLMCVAPLSMADGHGDLGLEKRQPDAPMNVTSVLLGEEVSSISAEGDMEGYGKVYLSYEFVSSSADKNQGDFSGDIRTINNDGVMVAGTLQGIWKRDGKMVTMYTLDQFSNGDMIYAKGDVDLVKGTMSFTAYPIQ